jgi:hypothetical protein
MVLAMGFVAVCALAATGYPLQASLAASGATGASGAMLLGMLRAAPMILGGVGVVAPSPLASATTTPIDVFEEEPTGVLLDA